MAELEHRPQADPMEAADRFLARPPLELGDWSDAEREIEASLEREAGGGSAGP